MGSYHLSLCIPTYNFGEFIGDTLESIRAQMSGHVEVVVLDGGSTDNTPTIVQSYLGLIPTLRYHRQEWRGGIDRDIARAVELATGEYCWLFSSDDVMRPGAIPRILTEIQLGFDVYLVGRIECTRRMRPVRTTRVLSVQSDGEFDLGDTSSRALYFSRATSTYAFFAYMSSIIIKKSKWDQVPLDESFVGSCWAHVARIFRMSQVGLRLRYLADALVLCRGGNDSFVESGVANRIRIAVEGYHRIATELFGSQSPEALHIRRALRNEYRMRYLLAAKARVHRTGGETNATLLNNLVAKLYDGPPFTNRAYHLLYTLAPAWLLDPAHRVYKAACVALGY